MELKVYPRLSTECKRLMHRLVWGPSKKPGQPYYYEPQRRLLRRLASELNITEAAARKQLLEERKYLLEQAYGRPFQIWEI